MLRKNTQKFWWNKYTWLAVQSTTGIFGINVILKFQTVYYSCWI